MKKLSLSEVMLSTAAVSATAAVLVPAVAGAKSEASALSNLQHIVKGELLYQNDYDDSFVLSQFQIQPKLSAYMNWPILLKPYVQSMSNFVNPDTGDPQHYFSPESRAATPSNWNFYAQFGYNYEFLSPFALGGVSGSEEEQQALVYDSQHGFIMGAGRSVNASVRPARTVIFVSAQSFAQPGNGKRQFSLPDFDLATAPGTLGMLVASSGRMIGIGSLPNNNKKMYVNGWVMESPEGEITGDVRALKPHRGAYVAWVDGHVNVRSATELASGTDFATSKWNDARGVTHYGDNGCVVRQVDRYWWTLDGTLEDVR